MADHEVVIAGSLAVLLLVSTLSGIKAFPGEEKHDIGTLVADVQNWASLIENYILQLASDGIKKEDTQSFLDMATYKVEHKDGDLIVAQVKERLGDYFIRKKKAAVRLADQARRLYDNFIGQNLSTGIKHLANLEINVYKDADIPTKLPTDMNFNPYFKQNVSSIHSTVKISDEVPRDDQTTIDTVYYTAGLEKVILENKAMDKYVRWQYFGSTSGVFRIYPGRAWSINFAGFYNDYDPRARPWYIAATSGPKDVVIILDCSLSMKGEKFSIAKAVAKAVINTLTKQDYVNVICARASHWDEVGKWHLLDTEVQSCQPERMVPATIAHRKDLIRKIEKLKASGTSELEKGFEMAFNLLQSNPRTECQSLIVFATDGKDTDGEEVRCGPVEQGLRIFPHCEQQNKVDKGYYTRSGYVPGPICKYNWTKTWDIAHEKNKYLQARIFSYLIQEDAEIFPGRLACDHRGSMKKLVTGENIISQMSNYFDFLASNAKSQRGLWTSPYLDSAGLGMMVTYAIPVISAITEKTIGVVGVDATLDEIENFLTKHQWGSVYPFLINKQGEAIFHPRLKASTNQQDGNRFCAQVEAQDDCELLKDDPIFIPISQLEIDKYGNPSEFQYIEREMKAGNNGSVRVEKSRLKRPRTYYYAGLEDSEFSFAYSMADTDMVLRRSEEPKDRSAYYHSYFNLLKEYNSTLGRQEFDLYDYLSVQEDNPKYPGLRITDKFSTIFLAPKAHCHPTSYIYDDNLDKKTVDAHRWINSFEEDVGCSDDSTQKYEKGVRADVLITLPIEQIWKKRAFESLDQVKWTNVGLRSGVFRTFPGHRSTRTYDPTKRPWYKRTSGAPARTSISTPYMDAAGVGKINTISQAVFEGMTPRTDEECQNISSSDKKPGGCACNLDQDCIIGVCYISKGPGPNHAKRRCATERVEAVTGLDIMYKDLQNRTMELMQASDFKKSCDQKYKCPDGEPGCSTRCYLFDTKGFLVMDPDFLLARDLHESKYERVTLGRKEGEVMKDLIYKHGFLLRKESIDFQGTCRISPEFPKITLAGIPAKPEDKDDYYKNRGPIPKFSNEYGCIQDVVGYEVNDEALGPSGIITGNVSGPCMAGFYYVEALPKTNLYLLVIENWRPHRQSLFYNFHCQIARSIVDSGAYRIINGTCAHEDTSESTLEAQNLCPILRNLELDCLYTSAMMHIPSLTLIVIVLLMRYIIP